MEKKKRSHRPEGTSVIESNPGLSFRITQKFHFTDKQREFETLSKDPNTNIVFCDGPAGTAKTYISVYIALQMLSEKKISEIVYIRSIVESGSKKLGSLPGDIDDKFGPWVTPLLEKCDELIGLNTTNTLVEHGYIRCVPVNLLRGVTMKDCVVIVDESQNLDYEELVTILTRFGRNCKMFIIGDTFQSDIHRTSFKIMHDTFGTTASKENGIFSIELTEADITRSKLLRFIVTQLQQSKSVSR